MKKRIIIITCAVLAVAALVCLAPWPTRIDVTMQGTKVSADGQIICENEFHLRGWKLDFLFLQDKILLEPIALPGGIHTLDFMRKTEELQKPPLSPYAFTLTFAYLRNENRIIDVNIAFGHDMSYCMIQVGNGEHCYTGSVSSNRTPQQILDELGGLWKTAA